MKTIIQLVLDTESAAKVRALAVHPIVFAHHVTIAYCPTPEQRAEYAPLIGQTIAFEGVAVFTDDKGQALYCRGIDSLNDYPHITVSCAPGVKPVYSNRLIADTDHGVDVRLALSGTVVEQALD